MSQLSPKRTKFRKQHKGRTPGYAKGGNQVSFGDFGMQILEPVGRHVIQICCTLSCALVGAEKLVKRFEQRLGIHVGETTKDGRFTLKKVECLASCGSAPMLQVNEDKFLENLTEADVDRIVDSLP